ncbi:EamA family transporter RarD [Spirulina major CS-329]|uniref:EamA family transporter RarD n=1 Tax=Spirulina TaxID=1154 RepID=UPI00232AF4F1|nr:MULTISPECIES: EamA family transporter RarD [Spirulina]MDB9494250.1 EamA family transporter RarD [Spirulina subsalsa CS-330]MDB9501835.1 EamA family transporter RarD [Spirulina major CS-329]
MNQTPASTTVTGVLYAVFAYGAWGLLPIYWKLFGVIPAVEVLSHRMIWSMVFLLSILTVQRRWPELRQVLRSRRQLLGLFITTSLLAFNWGIYIYGVNSDRVVETSLGYYICPLVTMLLGLVVLRERLNWVQWVAVSLAGAGVVIFIQDLGQVPWIALGLAFSFALYGLLRKMIAIAPLVGLAVETLMIAPLLLILVGVWELRGLGHFTATPGITLAFIGAGIVTSMPLLWFNNAAKRLPLVSLGFYQYLAPTLQLSIGVFLYREPFTTTHGITFGCIWAALALYSANTVMLNRAKLREPSSP